MANIIKRVLGPGAFGVLAAAMMLVSTSAQAADYYAAIAYSQNTDAHGWAYDYRTKVEAESAAMLNCAKYGGGCKVVTWCKNACCALAVGRGNAYGADWGRSKNEAISLAVKRCHSSGSNCRMRRWVCTTR